MISNNRSNKLVPIWLIAIILISTSFTANAALVQITQYGNQITSAAGNNLNPDLTGDGNADISLYMMTSSNYAPTAWDATAGVNGIIFETWGGSVYGDAIYKITDTSTSTTIALVTADGIAGETYFMPFTFTDSAYNPISVDAILEIRVQGHETLPEQNGLFLRRVLFDLDTHGTPTGYSEFTSYPEAQHVVPIPAAAWLFGSALAGLGLFGRTRKQNS